MNSEGRPAVDEKRETLRARAMTLAQPLESHEAASTTLQAVEFLLAQERYAIEMVFVKIVHPLTEITPVPCTPPFVLGIINVRGQIVTVIDIKRFFDLPDKGISDLNKVLIIHAAGMEVGILADAIIGGREVKEEDLQEAPPTLTGIRGEYLRGVTSDRVVLLDVEKILSDKRILVDEQVEA